MKTTIHFHQNGEFVSTAVYDIPTKVVERASKGGVTYNLDEKACNLEPHPDNKGELVANPPYLEPHDEEDDHEETETGDETKSAKKPSKKKK